jgi:predicted dehydrogenase
VDLCSALVNRPLTDVSATSLGSGPTTLEHDSFLLTLRYDDGSLGVITYVATGSPHMAKERVEVLGAGRSAVIDDFRRVMLHESRGRLPRPGGVTKDKGHRAALEAFLGFLRAGGPPPIAYDRLLETTRATLVARDALTSDSSHGTPPH